MTVIMMKFKRLYGIILLSNLMPQNLLEIFRIILGASEMAMNGAVLKEAIVTNYLAHI